MLSLILRVKRKGLPEQEQTHPVSNRLAAQLMLHVGMRTAGDRRDSFDRVAKAPLPAGLLTL